MPVNGMHNKETLLENKYTISHNKWRVIECLCDLAIKDLIYVFCHGVCCENHVLQAWLLG